MIKYYKNINTNHIFKTTINTKIKGVNMEPLIPLSKKLIFFKNGKQVEWCNPVKELIEISEEEAYTYLLADN